MGRHAQEKAALQIFPGCRFWGKNVLHSSLKPSNSIPISAHVID
jgi:hypothetical protein